MTAMVAFMEYNREGRGKRKTTHRSLAEGVRPRSKLLFSLHSFHHLEMGLAVMCKIII